jgi:hypothetical protein
MGKSKSKTGSKKKSRKTSTGKKLAYISLGLLAVGGAAATYNHYNKPTPTLYKSGISPEQMKGMGEDQGYYSTPPPPGAIPGSKLSNSTMNAITERGEILNKNVNSATKLSAAAASYKNMTSSLAGPNLASRDKRAIIIPAIPGRADALHRGEIDPDIMTRDNASMERYKAREGLRNLIKKRNNFI